MCNHVLCRSFCLTHTAFPLFVDPHGMCCAAWGQTSHVVTKMADQVQPQQQLAALKELLNQAIESGTEHALDSYGILRWVFLR